MPLRCVQFLNRKNWALLAHFPLLNVIVLPWSKLDVFNVVGLKKKLRQHAQYVQFLLIVRAGITRRPALCAPA